MKKTLGFLLVVITICSASLSLAGHDDLQLISYYLLENDSGDRYARITFDNISNKISIVESRYFIATLMDAKKTKVKGVSGASGIRINPGETQSVVIFF